MKSLNLKKVAAVTAGVALVAASVTAAAVNWTALANSADHTMNVNGIVYGDGAALSDATAATSLAGKLATLATYEVTEDVNTCKEVAVEGTGTYVFDKTKAKKYTGTTGSAINETANYNQVEGLLNWSSKKYKVGSNETTTMREMLEFNATPFFNADEDVARLTAELTGGDLVYTVEFAQNIDLNADGEWTEGDWYDNVSSRNIEIPFLGKTYKIYRVSEDMTELDLFEVNAIKTYAKGEKVEGLTGKDGKSYYAVIDSVLSDGAEIRMSLYAADGTPVADYAREPVEQNAKYAEDFLATQVYVTDAYDDSDNADLRNWVVEMAVGKDALTVKTAEGFPYDSTITDDDEYFWEATITTDGVDQLESISLTNRSNLEFEDEEGLAPGKEVSFYNDFARLMFVGLELPSMDSESNTELSPLKLGTSVSYGASSAPGLEYMDTDDQDHAVPFYVQLKMTEVTTGTGNLADYYKTFTYDGTEYTAYIDTDNDQLLVEEGARESDKEVTGGEDLNVVAEELDLADLTTVTTEYGLTLNDDATDVNYVTVFDEDDKTLWFMLNPDTITFKYGTAALLASNVNSTGSLFDDSNIEFYVPKDSQFKKLVPEVDDDDSETFTVAGFRLSDSTDNFDVYFNTESEKLVKSGDDDGESVPFGGQVDMKVAENGAEDDLSLNRGDDDEITSAYSPRGTLATVTADYTLELVVPEEVVEAKFWLYTAAGAGALEGATTKTECTMTPTKKDVAFKGLPFTPIKASEVEAGKNYIVVGGYMVNSMFPSQEELVTLGITEPLAAEGDKVTAAANGNVYVAGYTAQDTTDAVDALIAVLESAKP